MPKVYCLQLDTRWHDKAANHADVVSRLSAVRPEPGSMIVLSEMFDVGFTMNTQAALAGPDSVDFVASLARRHGCTVVAGAVISMGADKPVNAAIVVGADGNVLTRYAKCHGFSPAGESEKYAAGEGPTSFEWAGLSVAPLVCYDLRFPELFRMAMRHGAEVFVVIANWPAARIGHWLTLAQARAIENLAYVVAVNRCGSDPHLNYPGQSIVVDPQGVVLARAGESPEVLVAEIDVERVRAWRRDFPALRDARFV